MVEEPAVKKVLSVRSIHFDQNSEGGWRYRPSRESDMSITVSGARAVLGAQRRHPFTTTIKNAQSYCPSQCRAQQRPGTYRMRGARATATGGSSIPDPRGHRATFPLTAAGVTTLHAAGEHDSPIIRDALDFMDRTVQSSAGTTRATTSSSTATTMRCRPTTSRATLRRNTWLIKSLLLQQQRSNGSWPCTVGPATLLGRCRDADPADPTPIPAPPIAEPSSHTSAPRAPCGHLPLGAASPSASILT
jgi:hypothetical protein